MTLAEYLNLCEKLTFFGSQFTQGSVAYNIRWYARRHPWYRIAYITSGIVALALMFVGPQWFVTESWSDTTLHSIGALIVALTTFFAFKHGWAGYYLAQFKLELLKDRYEEAIGRARLMAEKSEEAAVELAVSATNHYMEEAGKVIEEETKGYFASTKFPAKLPE